MAVTLKTLILVSPFTPDDRQKMLVNIDYLDEDKKSQIADVCWKILAAEYFTKLKFMIDNVLGEVADGKRPYNKNDITEVQAKLTHEFAQKLQSADTEEQISEVKKQLETYKTKPLIQDKVTSSPLDPNQGKPPPVQKP